jgi:nucleotidyltransferase-like protein
MKSALIEKVKDCMVVKEKGISNSINSRPLALHLNYGRLFDDAHEVIVFGSRAAGVHRPLSDLDLLCITPKKRRIRAAGLDCVLLLPEEVNTPFWLGSELACHVVRYGKWEKGAGEWRDRAHVSDRAITRKQQRIVSVSDNAARRWSRLHPIFQMKYAVTIRRELQRLDLLLNRVAIPPTPILDSIWLANRGSTSRLVALARELGQLPSFASTWDIGDFVVKLFSLYFG